MKSLWWKILAIIILVYTFIAGMLVPLKPGISDVSPSNGRTGEKIDLAVVGYNTFFTRSNETLRAWLKLDNKRALQAQNIEVKHDQLLHISFAIPEYLPVGERVQDFTLVIDSEEDGASVLPSAVFITQDSLDPEMGQKVWVNSPIQDLHEKAAMTFPFRNILSETIRNTYFHVPLWLAMVIIFLASVVFNVRFLRARNPVDDLKALALIRIGVLYGVLGVITGAIWAKFTWGAYWSWDVKQNMTAIALLIYLAYFVLRNAFEDMEQKARLSAVYSIFAFATLIPLIYVIPRLTDSLHPGAGGNPAFGSQDLDNTMRMVFYPAVIGWTLFGVWLSSLALRIDLLKEKLMDW